VYEEVIQEMDTHSQPARATEDSAGPEDEIREAEAEFTSKQGGTPSDRMVDDSPAGEHPTGRPLDSADQQPRKKLKLTEADKKRNVRMFGSLMVISFSLLLGRMTCIHIKHLLAN
jgi:hypothetical protein